MRQVKILLLGTILIGSFAAGQVYAFDTSALGGSAGTADWSLGCGSKRVTGVRVRHGTVIDKIKLRCTEISSTGAWSNTNHEWTDYTASDSPNPATDTADALCGSNRFVAGFNVYRRQITTGQTVVARVALKCRQANAQSVATGTDESPEAGAPATGGSWNQTNLFCTSSGVTMIAFGARGRRGWYLDNVKLRCVDPPATPSAAPTLVFPRWNATAVGDDYGATPGWVVRLQSVSGAVKYQICLRDSGAQNCYYNQTLDASSAFASGNTLQFAVTIPADRQSTISQWTARACNSVPQCGPWAATAESFTVVPSPPTLSAPADNQVISNTRTVTFTWQANQAANAGYQLVLWRTGQQSGYSVYSPAAALTAPHQSIQIPAGTTSYTYNLAPGLTSVQWGVYACANFTNKGRRCSLGTQPRGFTVPAFFGFAMAPTFRHERCANCHAVVPDNFAKDTSTDTSKGLPSNHTTVNASTNCATCHTNSLLPTQGTINPGWHAPSGMDFRNRTDAQLCTMAQTFGGAGSVLNHLTQDKLILWAIGDGRRPSNSTPYPTAPPNNITTWQGLVQSWVNAGTPCN